MKKYLEGLHAGGASRKLPPVVAHVLLHEADEVGDRHGAEHRRPDWRAAGGELAACGFVSRVSRLQPGPSLGRLSAARPPGSWPASSCPSATSGRSAGAGTRCAAPGARSPGAWGSWTADRARAPPTHRGIARCARRSGWATICRARAASPRLAQATRRRRAAARPLAGSPPAPRRSLSWLPPGGAAHPAIRQVSAISCSRASSSRRMRRRPISSRPAAFSSLSASVTVSR